MLSEAELEVLRLLAEGLTMREAADRLHLSERTVSRRLNLTCARLGVERPIEAVVWAVRQGLM